MAKRESPPNPLIDEDNTDAANRAARASLDDRLKEESGVTEVQVDDDEDDDDEPSEPTRTAPTRGEKKRDRGKNYIAAREDAARADERAKIYQELANRPQQPQPQAPPASREPAPPTALERQRDVIRREQKALLTEFNSLPEEQQRAKSQEYTERAQKLKDEEEETSYQIRRAKETNGQPQGSQDPTIVFLKGKYPQVVAHDKAMVWAQGHYQQAVARGEVQRRGYPAVLEDSLKAAAREFRLAGASYPEPSERQRERYSSTRGGTQDSRGTGGTVQVTATEKRLALAMYKGLKNVSDDQKVQMWVKKVKLKSREQRA